MEAVVEWSDLYDGFYGDDFEDEAESRVGISDHSQRSLAAVEVRGKIEAFKSICTEPEQPEHIRTEARKEILNRSLRWFLRQQGQAYRKGVTRAREALKAIREADKKKPWVWMSEERTKRMNEPFHPSPALVFWRQQFEKAEQPMESPNLLFRKF